MDVNWTLFLAVTLAICCVGYGATLFQFHSTFLVKRKTKTLTLQHKLRMALCFFVAMAQISCSVLLYCNSETVNGIIASGNVFYAFGLNITFLLEFSISAERFITFMHIPPSSYTSRGLKGIVLYMFLNSIAEVAITIENQISIQNSPVIAIYSTSTGLALMAFGNIQAMIGILGDFILNITMVRKVLRNQSQLLTLSSAAPAKFNSGAKVAKDNSIQRMVTLFVIVFVIDLLVVCVEISGNLIVSPGLSSITGATAAFFQYFAEIVGLPFHTLAMIKLLDMFRVEALKKVAVKQQGINNSPISFFNDDAAAGISNTNENSVV